MCIIFLGDFELNKNSNSNKKTKKFKKKYNENISEYRELCSIITFAIVGFKKMVSNILVSKKFSFQLQITFK